MRSGVCVSFVMKCFQVYKPLFHRAYLHCDQRIVLSNQLQQQLRELQPQPPWRQPQNNTQTQIEPYSQTSRSQCHPPLNPLLPPRRLHIHCVSELCYSVLVVRLGQLLLALDLPSITLTTS